MSRSSQGHYYTNFVELLPKIIQVKLQRHTTLGSVAEQFVPLYVFSFPPGVYVGAYNSIASIPGPSILTSRILPYIYVHIHLGMAVILVM